MKSNTMTQKQNLAYYEKQASRYSGHYVSWWDRNMVNIEINTIAPFISQNDYVLDVGCSTGFSTNKLQKISQAQFYGIDYSLKSIRQAQKISNSKLQFKHQDILKFNQTKIFNKAVSIRCLINLMNKKDQLRALVNIHAALKPKGKLILCECFESGLVNLNRARKFFHLPPLPMPSHNLYFNETQLKKNIHHLFKFNQEIRHASLYYLGTRILQYLNLEENEEPNRNSAWNKFFGQFGHQTKHSGDFSPNKVLILEKK